MATFQYHPHVNAPYVNHPTRLTKQGRPARVLYGRPSNFGAQVENRFNLERWSERRVLFGAALIDDLCEVVGWDIEDPEVARRLDGMVLDAKDRAGAKLAAQRGTLTHTFTEHVDRHEESPITTLNYAEELGLTTKVIDAVLESYGRLLGAYNLEILAIEQTVVDDRWRLAGRLDRVARLRRDLMFADGTVMEAGDVPILDIKGLALNTALPTPTGWTTIAEVKVGDRVIGSDGRACNVVEKSQVRHRPCYRLVFDDLTEVVADDEHRWLVRTDAGEQLMTTEEMFDRQKRRLRDGRQRDLRIENAEPLDLSQAFLPIDPYVLGCWIGDGNRGTTAITKPAEFGMWAEIERRGYRLGVEQIDKRTGCCTRTVLGMLPTLHALDLLNNKHIPKWYLRGSYEQRLDLLRGLMDTDGCWNKPRRQAQFCTISKPLAHQVYELVVSLGWRAHLAEIQRTGFGKTVTAYDITFTAFGPNPFIAKADRVTRLDGAARSRRRLVKTIERIDSVPTQCIAVDSPDHTYLCTESMLVTHNTGRIKLDRNGVPDYWHSYAVQIASYSHSVPYIIAEDAWDEARDEWPWEISQSHGLILHLDVNNAMEEGVATARLFHVDLDAGHRAGDLCRAARDWQSAAGVVQPLAADPIVVNVR